MGSPVLWPPPELDVLGSPESVGLVVPAVRHPSEREANVVAQGRKRAATLAGGGTEKRVRKKQNPAKETSASVGSQASAEAAASSSSGPPAPPSSRPSSELVGTEVVAESTAEKRTGAEKSVAPEESTVPDRGATGMSVLGQYLTQLALSYR